MPHKVKLRWALQAAVAASYARAASVAETGRRIVALYDAVADGDRSVHL